MNCFWLWLFIFFWSRDLGIFWVLVGGVGFGICFEFIYCSFLVWIMEVFCILEVFSI